MKDVLRIHSAFIGRASFKFCMGDKLMEQMEGGKKDDTIFSAL